TKGRATCIKANATDSRGKTTDRTNAENALTIIDVRTTGSRNAIIIIDFRTTTIDPSINTTLAGIKAAAPAITINASDADINSFHASVDAGTVGNPSLANRTNRIAITRPSSTHNRNPALNYNNGYTKK